jgi:16S rRNA (adenine1518-N6/adenine1519-N6)-dimethyltransferase
VSILREDALRFDYLGWATSSRPLKPVVVGNIPYRITNSLLYTLIGSHSRLETVVLMLQEEVARKICASAGHKPYGLLTVLASYNSKVEYLFRVGRDNFSPPPNVDSAVIRLDFAKPCQSRAADEALFEALVRRLFLDRRKQIQKILRNDRSFAVSAGEIGLLEQDTGLKLSCRPEELTVEQLVALADGLGSMKVRT